MIRAGNIKYLVMLTIVLQCLPVLRLQAQVKPVQPEPGEPPSVIQQQLENLTESNDDLIPQDDSYLQNLAHFTKEPINLNSADAGELQELQLLTPVQISNLITYRKLLGNFLSIYELQAIPDWDLTVIRRIRPYIIVTANADVINNLKSRFGHGQNALLVRSIETLEKSKGYQLKGSGAANFYPGSAQHFFLRYKYTFKNLLQYGITADKDAGEQFFKGSQKSGFDFYSAHLYVRNLGIIKSLALGDFTVNMGQGLTQWGGLAFNKGAEILNIKRQSDVLRPYNSSGEIFFNRGAGITLQKHNWEATAFASFRKMDANLHVDTLGFQDYVSSLQTSGYHRTPGEVADKGTQGQTTLGGNLNYNNNKLQIGINAVHYTFQHYITKAAYLYNAYSLSGKTLGNYSIDYSYTYQNMHFFGEAATDNHLNKAFINGLLISLDQHVDMSFLYRNISKGYQSLYSNAFTEGTYPNNESGFYSGITITPVEVIRIDAYADFYKFPWLKYRVDAPSSGNDYLLQLTYKPNKQAEVHIRYRAEKKAINYNPDLLALNPVVMQPRQGLRSQFSYRLTNAVTLRSRAEMNWYDRHGPAAESGFLFYTDILYKPFHNAFSGNVRLQYFETDGYNSRMYAFEDDVLYAYSIPVFFGKGYRYYTNVNYDLNKKFFFWVRFAQTIYSNINTIGSGLDMIKGNTKSEITVQCIYNF